MMGQEEMLNSSKYIFVHSGAIYAHHGAREAHLGPVPESQPRAVVADPGVLEAHP
jgi:hypothetical protein